MNQWSPDQLLHAAEAASTAGRFQDAVTVLVYLVQSHPDAEEADRARLLYRELTGTECPDAEVVGSAVSEEAKPSVANGFHKKELVKLESDGSADAELGDASEDTLLQEAKSDEEPLAATSAPIIIDSPSSADGFALSAFPVTELSGHASAQGGTTIALPRRSGAALIAEFDQELALERNERFGHFLAHIFFSLGFLILPVGLLMLVFSLAFGFLLPWALGALLAAAPLMALGQLLRIAFDMRADMRRLLDQQNADRME